MSGHTPGIWQRLSGDVIGVLNGYGESHIIAELYISNKFRDVKSGIAERAANARLIAAAPEMAAALKDCLIFFEDYFGDCCDGDLSAPIHAVLQKAGVLDEE